MIDIVVILADIGTIYRIYVNDKALYTSSLRYYHIIILFFTDMSVNIYLYCHIITNCD